MLLYRTIVAFLKDPEYRDLLSTTSFILIIGSVVYHFVEGWDWIDCLYFSVITLTTIGYGDIAPETVGGKIFTMFYIIIGIGIILSFVNTLYKHYYEMKTNRNSDPEFIAIYEKAIKHSMVLLMLADGVIKDSEKVQLLEVINKFTHIDLSGDQLDNYIQRVQKEKEDVATYLRKVAPSLNEHGKEVLIKCAFSLAAVDDNISKVELEMISKMGEALNMSNLHMKGIHAEMQEERPVKIGS